MIFYPKGKISEIQEKQLTTQGQNMFQKQIVRHCQEMVKMLFWMLVFLHFDLPQQILSMLLILPQMFYYFIAYRTLKNKNKKLVFSVPSGNFGNICAGIMSKQMGLPISHFIASTNVNDTVPRYLKTGNYEPFQTKQTITTNGCWKSE